MQISVRDAQENLEQVLDRMERGEDIVLTREGRTVARIVPAQHETSREGRRAALGRVRAMAPPKKPGGPGADRSHDDLYDEDGLPA
ncbi:type II toxin-antitoxin system Phd/YefM family antitoxin [Rhizobium sp. SGZ-381]|uniref:type II toxin-antitoxin system Phd/YefM family antitoxin n=1 Tax=Rhizobium sp. SGZ-381 TaxID=3342800 RepID=UPI00366A7B64